MSERWGKYEIMYPTRIVAEYRVFEDGVQPPVYVTLDLYEARFFCIQQFMNAKRGRR